MQLTLPVLLEVIGGVLVVLFLVFRRRSSASLPYPTGQTRSGRGNGTMVLLVLAGLVGAFLFGRSGAGLPFSWSSLPTVFASSQHALTNLQASISSQASSSAYQSLPLPKTAYPQYVTQAQKDATAVGLVPAVFIRQMNQESGFNSNL